MADLAELVGGLISGIGSLGIAGTGVYSGIVSCHYLQNQPRSIPEAALFGAMALYLGAFSVFLGKTSVEHFKEAV